MTYDHLSSILPIPGGIAELPGMTVLPSSWHTYLLMSHSCDTGMMLTRSSTRKKKRSRFHHDSQSQPIITKRGLRMSEHYPTPAETKAWLDEIWSTDPDLWEYLMFYEDEEPALLDALEEQMYLMGEIDAPENVADSPDHDRRE